MRYRRYDTESTGHEYFICSGCRIGVITLSLFSNQYSILHMNNQYRTRNIEVRNSF
jgi:hypothetical protein